MAFTTRQIVIGVVAALLLGLLAWCLMGKPSLGKMSSSASRKCPPYWSLCPDGKTCLPSSSVPGSCPGQTQQGGPGSSCVNPYDCQLGLSCIGGVCNPPTAPIACTRKGSPCQQPSDCCSGQCGAPQGRPIQCVAGVCNTTCQ